MPQLAEALRGMVSDLILAESLFAQGHRVTIKYDRATEALAEFEKGGGILASDANVPDIPYRQEQEKNPQY